MAQLFFISTLLLGSVALGAGEGAQRDGILKGRIVAVGVPGASAISSVPPFLPGGLHAVETYPDVLSMGAD